MHTDARFWDRLARKYAASPIKNTTAYEATLERVAARLGPNDSVLEIGCGTGSTALRLAENVGTFTGADVSRGMINIAKEKLAGASIPNLHFTVAAANETRFDPEAFDAVLGFNILHLIEDLPSAAKRAHQLLKPGGLFISKTPCLAEMSFVIRMVLPVMQLFRKAPFVAFLTRLTLEKQIRDAGFQIEESRTFDGSPTTWYVVARKPQS